MYEISTQCTTVISEADAAARVAQGLGLVELFTQIWLDNPKLLKQAGCRIEEFMMPIEQAQLLHASDLL
jgi:hypothetical protein